MDKSVKVINIDDKYYPTALKELKGLAPKKLYYKGNFCEDIFMNSLAVVGSRRLTVYGRKSTEQLVTQTASAGITIVSGFMYGGDEAAHSAAIKCGGRTIAVMPCGINIVHPESQTKLYRDILENNGLIISEYEGDFMPQTWSYVQRNRIVAGLSKAILVTEATLNSGSLLTAGYAKKFGKKIFALPGQITSEVSKGTIKLIKEGAEPVMEAKDILDFYKILPSKNCSSPALGQIDSLEQKIINQLKAEPLKADQIARAVGLPVAQIGTTLSLMEMKGFVSQTLGKYYIN